MGAQPRPAAGPVWPENPTISAQSAGTSALGVAGPGADHAILAAVLVAGRERDVLRLSEPARRRISVRAARAPAVDRKGGAALLEHHHHLALRAGAFALRGAHRRSRVRIVEGVAEGRARPDRHRARRMPGRDAGGPDEDAGSRTGQRP